MKPNRRWIWMALCLILGNTSLFAQWNLQTCIDYALQHNLNLQRTRMNAEGAEVDVKTAKAAFFPSLSASVGQRVVNRPNNANGTIINGDNITSSTDKTSYNGSYGIDLNWTLFQGTHHLQTLKQRRLNRQIADLDIAENENSIEESITQIYVQILYAMEAVKVCENTLAVSQAECERGRQLLEAGSISKSDLAQLEAQVSMEKYQLVVAEAGLQDYKIQLKQLLELEGEEEMVLDLPVLNDEKVLQPLPSRTEVYGAAVSNRPEIEAGRLGVEASDLDIRIAQSGYYPSLSLSAGIGTSNTNSKDFSFSEQMKSNWNNSVGLNLRIPLFSNWQNKSAVQKARLQKQSSELDLQERQKTLYKAIENLWWDANSAQLQYVAAIEKLRSTQISYDLVSEQFELGMKNTVELLTEKNNLLNAQQEMLQAKYKAILNSQLLRFYSGEKMEL